MTKYKVLRVFNNTECTYIEANSENEAIQKAIDNDCWEENPNDIFLGYEYITVKEDANN